VVGLSLFSIGLAKKLLVADPISQYVGPVFDVGTPPGLLPAWTGTLAFTFQIYFDFSGYSDMALGMSRFFGIALPVNFNSPYKATSIIDFWRRWHMTLSAFLKDYLYIPLGGNRRGAPRRYANVILTMPLGGLWHGANWTFLIWGGVHGIYLCINHLWRSAACRLGLGQSSPPIPAFSQRRHRVYAETCKYSTRKSAQGAAWQIKSPLLSRALGNIVTRERQHFDVCPKGFRGLL
jgi:alginate O-acetyltransferase complex protein AlgI